MDLYVMYESPYCRSVLMAAKFLNLELNVINYNLARGEHLNEDFKKINPRRCVPTLVDNGFVLCESRAIMTYLANKYAPSSSLYPSDPVLRAQVDQYLYLDLEKLAIPASTYLKPLILKGILNSDALDVMAESLSLYETILTGKKFLVNEQLTLADIAVIATLSSYESCGQDFSKYKALQKWLANVKEAIPFYDEINAEAIKAFHEVIQSKIKEVKSNRTA